MRKEKWLKRGLLWITLLVVPFFVLCIVKADSGWDSSYDSGSSSWSSSDSGWSSSSWDSSSYGGSGDGDINVSSVMFFVIIFFIVLMIFILGNKGSSKNTSLIDSRYKDLSEEDLQKILPNLSLAYLKDMAFKKFVEIQEAWMDFDYERLRELCTDELYNSYISQLEVLKLKNGQNIMSDFRLIDLKIYEVLENSGIVTVNVYMQVSFYDYVIDMKTKAVTRGTKSNKICNEYVMTFVRSKDEIKKDISCPNCGAPITHNTSGECEYCGSTIVKAADDFVLSKKTNIKNQV